jgi:hypothetical protein
VLQAFGKVIDFAVVNETLPPADSVVRLVKMSPFVELFDVMVMFPVPVVVMLLFEVAK